jgi:hypothetical protein
MGKATVRMGEPAEDFMTALSKKSLLFVFLGLAGVAGAGLAALRPADDDKPPDAAAESFQVLQLEATQRELIQVQADLRKTRLERDFWHARDEAFRTLPIPKSALDERLSQDPAVARQMVRLAELRDQIAGVEGTVQPGKAPTVLKDFRAQLAAAEKNLEALKQAVRPQIVEQLREKAYDEYKGKLVQFQEQVEWLKEWEKALQGEVERLSRQTRELKASRDQRLDQVEKELRELRASVAELKRAK